MPHRMTAATEAVMLRAQHTAVQQYNKKSQVARHKTLQHHLTVLQMGSTAKATSQLATCCILLCRTIYNGTVHQKLAHPHSSISILLWQHDHSPASSPAIRCTHSLHADTFVHYHHQGSQLSKKADAPAGMLQTLFYQHNSYRELRA